MYNGLFILVTLCKPLGMQATQRVIIIIQDILSIDGCERVRINMSSKWILYDGYYRVSVNIEWSFISYYTITCLDLFLNMN